jgi:DNA transformation protein and related proteins
MRSSRPRPSHEHRDRTTRRTATRSPRSLAVSDGFRAFVVDQLEELDVTPKPMFGGVGLYARGVFFGILARNDTLYLKVDAVNRGDYEAVGAKPFQPYPDRPATMRYYPVPVAVLESAPALVVWARRAIAAAERAAAPLVRRQADDGTGSRGSRSAATSRRRNRR